MTHDVSEAGLSRAVSAAGADRPPSRTSSTGRLIGLDLARGKVLIRSAVLMSLGYVLTSLNTQVDVILAAYGMIFVLALPLYRLRALASAGVAAATTVVLPRAGAGRR